MHRENLSPGGPAAQNPLLPVVYRAAGAFATLGPHPWHSGGVWPALGVAGLACAAVCRGDGGHCVPGAGWGVTLLAAWAEPACAGTARGEGRTEEFAIWASLLLRCCYGTAEMLPGRRGGLCLSPLGSLEVGRCPRYVKPCSLAQPHQEGMGFLMIKIPQLVGLQGLFVQLVSAFNWVR